LKREIYLADQRTSISSLTAPRGRFSVVVIDPPWPYQKREGDVTKRGAIPYPAMSIEAIQAITIPATDNCLLWLWTTNAFMHEAYHVLEAWGFEAKTILTWIKNRMGVGDWLRGKTEHCILAIRGRPVITLTNQTTVLYGDRQNHSQKPEEFFSLVESLCPASPKLAMFFDIHRAGWQCYGVQQKSL
jgi:N6-adenosine-specific RNA methylase IME4